MKTKIVIYDVKGNEEEQILCQTHSEIIAEFAKISNDCIEWLVKEQHSPNLVILHFGKGVIPEHLHGIIANCDLAGQGGFTRKISLH